MLLASAEYSFYFGRWRGPQLICKGRSVCCLCQKVNLTEVVMTLSLPTLHGCKRVGFTRGWTNHDKKYVKGKKFSIIMEKKRYSLFPQVLFSCEAACLLQVTGVQDLPRTLSSRWSSCLQVFFMQMYLLRAGQLQNSPLAFTLRGTKTAWAFWRGDSLLLSFSFGVLICFKNNPAFKED